MHWKKVTLVGVGLLGGSLGLALRQRGLAGSVAGFVRRQASLRECRGLGAVDVATRNLAQAVAGAELVVLCTPIAQMRLLVEEMLPALRPGAILTDVGSVKASVLADLEPLAAKAGARFVGSHPMAGGEKAGVQAAREDLFVNAVCLVTPSRRTQPAALREVELLWRSVGARVLRLTAANHDELVSRSSHLPHVVAAELARYVLSPEHSRNQGLLCANGFRDTTRIASGSPEMWRDIALANQRHLLKALDTFGKRLGHFRRLLQNGDPETLRHFFEQAKQRRDRWFKQTGSASGE